jgi:SAM-dependent methyltransferase
MDPATDKYITLDEEGYFAFDGKRVDDEKYGRELLGNLQIDDRARLQTSLSGQAAWVESFDSPLLGRHVQLKGPGLGTLDLNYNFKADFRFSDLSLDQWDRIHGHTVTGLPFVFTRQGQVELFDLLDEFDDDSITVQGKRQPMGPWLNSFEDANRGEFWTNIYKNEEPGWELHQPHPALTDIVPQLKLSKAKILVLGCGSGHDAAFFAQQGHLVTGVDFSSEAINRAKENYGTIEDLSFVQADAFALPDQWAGRFDMIFEHTFYCAITPERRDELVKTWRRMLMPQGRLLGIFFVNERRMGPPFGGSEWEVRQRLRKDFRFNYWTRWRKSIDKRKSIELILFGQRQG